ncbi:MAG: hypothetical protein HOP20_07990 [Sulfuriferula sp.]|nr:hypothetical protein [Sulfuriferula sp.]
MAALIASDGLSGEVLNAWCRERGLFAHHLTAWRKAFCTNKPVVNNSQDLRALKAQNDQLKRELSRSAYKSPPWLQKPSQQVRVRIVPVPLFA